MSAYRTATDGADSAPDTIIGVGVVTGGYWVTFARADGHIYSEQWPACPPGWEARVDGY